MKMKTSNLEISIGFSITVSNFFLRNFIYFYWVHTHMMWRGGPVDVKE